MRQFSLMVREMAEAGGQIHVRCDGPAAQAVSGQFYLARAAADSFLRLPLFPFSTSAGAAEFCLAPDHPFADLAPGQPLDLIGPCGRGFQLPPLAAHLLVAAASLDRVFGLIRHALERGLAVALLWPDEGPLPDLAPEVEVQRGPLSAELAAWADVVALDVDEPFARAREIRALSPLRTSEYVQAVWAPPMPCGTGACQACWVEPRPGSARRLACVDGPVFAL